MNARLHTVENDPELAAMVAEGKRWQQSRPKALLPDVADVPGLSTDELARRFTEVHGQELRHVPAWGWWLKWDGTRWARDEKLAVFDMARTLLRSVVDEQLGASELSDAQRKALRQRLGSATMVWDVVKMAGTDPRHAVGVNELDADPWVLNTPGGMLDLQTGALDAHDPAKLITKVTAATPGGDCPLFREVLATALPDAEVRDYVQRLAGYGLAGSSREHVLPFGYGQGRNSKGTIFHAIRRAMGDYGLEIGAETLMESHNDRHLTELAVLRGARFVVASEVDSGRRWNESRVKRLTGGDPISARYIAKDLFEFEPTHTLIVIANNKPGLRNVDEAIRSRLHLIPFSVVIPEADRDPTLAEKLVAEYPGILAWALAGCLNWQSTGLRPPSAVVAASAEYLAGEDGIEQWVGECCQRSGQVTLTAAHKSYRDWCESSAMLTLGRNSFAEELRRRGFQSATVGRNKMVTFAGITINEISNGSRYGNDD